MLIIRLILFSLFCALGSIWSTQWIASTLNHERVLGKAAFYFGTYPIYWPWSMLSWMIQFSKEHPEAFGYQLLPYVIGVSLGALLAFFAGLYLTKVNQKGLKTHGSASWASSSEIKNAGLLAQSGVLLGLTPDRKHYLRHDGPEHICVYAPTRSGKGAGLVIPTLLSWQDSVICFDPKGENWTLTSGFRKQLGRCIYFDPTSANSARFNPLSEIRRGEYEVRDAQNIANVLVESDIEKQRPNHWERTANSFLVGAILHVIYAEPDKTLSGLVQFLADPKRTIQEILQVMLKTPHLDGHVHPVVASAARELLNKAPEELSGVFSTATSFLSLYRDPLVARATSTSDFKIADLMNGQEPVSLYLVLPPSDMTRTRTLLRLMLNQIGRILTEKLDPKPRRLLWLMDEFPTLGKLDFFESALAYMAGYGMRSMLITQSLNQIEDVYGRNNSILDNCHIRIAFASNDERTAKRISEMLGQKNEVKQQTSLSGRRSSWLMNQQSISFQEFGRPLLTASEVTQLPADQQIVFVSGNPPILAQKLQYYQDSQLLERILDPVPLEIRPENPRLKPFNLEGISL